MLPSLYLFLDIFTHESWCTIRLICNIGDEQWSCFLSKTSDIWRWPNGKEPLFNQSKAEGFIVATSDFLKNMVATIFTVVTYDESKWTWAQGCLSSSVTKPQSTFQRDFIHSFTYNDYVSLFNTVMHVQVSLSLTELQWCWIECQFKPQTRDTSSISTQWSLPVGGALFSGNDTSRSHVRT